MKTSRKRTTGIAELKRSHKNIQNGLCKRSGVKLPKENSLVDIHRLTPKRHGGIYTLENTEVDLPLQHLIIHNNVATWRSEELNHLKTLLERRHLFIKTRINVSNRISAIKRNTDYETPETVRLFYKLLAEAEEYEKAATKALLSFYRKINHPLKEAGKAVVGLGDITMCYILVYLNPKDAPNASKYWAYTGYDKSTFDRYSKGEKSGGNKKLRCALYSMAESMIKGKSGYTDVYYRTKDSLSVSLKTVKTRNTQGNTITCAWKDTKPSHRHGAAMRKMIKHFLADLWYVQRTMMGLPTRSLWIEDRGHTGIIRPEERGWIYPTESSDILELAS
jgi:hypothetical protein